MNKKNKRHWKEWIRYERMHSFTAVDLGWHTREINEKVIYVVLDNCLRYILRGGEFAAATGNSAREATKEILVQQ